MAALRLAQKLGAVLEADRNFLTPSSSPPVFYVRVIREARRSLSALCRLSAWRRGLQMHQLEPSPAEMAARYGAETPVPDLKGRLVCSQCGSREINLLLTGQREDGGWPPDDLVYVRAVAEFEKPLRPLDHERAHAEHPRDSRSDQ